MIIFGPIMQMLSENGWSSYRIRKERVLSEGTLSRLRNGQDVSTATLNILCRLCRCQPGDLISYVPDDLSEERE